MVNIGDPDGVPRLVSPGGLLSDTADMANGYTQITCVRSSQGYEWNPGLFSCYYLQALIQKLIISPEIFLPSYVDCDFEALERKHEVHEIRLSDEEIQQMFPQ